MPGKRSSAGKRRRGSEPETVTHEVDITFHSGSRTVSVSPDSVEAIPGDQIKWKAGPHAWLVMIEKDPGPMERREFRGRGRRAGGTVTLKPDRKTTFKYTVSVEVEGTLYGLDPHIVVRPRRILSSG